MSSADSLQIPFSESPFLRQALPELSPAEQETVEHFAERGYVVLDLDIPDFDAVAKGAIDCLADHYPDLDRRIDEAWYFCPEVRTIAAAPKVLDTLRLLYGRPAFPFQTLNFDRGTQQAAHSDTIHFHCVPRHFMCGVWAALEHVDERNGSLFVHPGSHRLPDLDMFDLGLRASPESYAGYEQRVGEILAAGGFEPEVLELEKGQAVIWAANLFHGGAPVREPGSTRHSQATHYYFEDCVYYFPMGTELVSGEATLREAIDIAEGRLVPPSHAGRPIHLSDYPRVWTYPRPLPDWVDGAAGEPSAVEEDADPEELRRRVRTMERTVATLREESRLVREDNLVLREDNERVREDNRKKDALIRGRDGELAYRVARRLTKTARALLGRGD